MKLYLVRHGQTDWNLERRMQGREDIPLNQNGILQARKVGQALAGCGIQCVASSPLRRALATAQQIAQLAGLGPTDVHAEAGLIERDMGRLSGHTWDSQRDYFAHATAEDPADGMEPRTAVAQRMGEVLEKYEAQGWDCVAFVTHGGAINALLGSLTGDEEGMGHARLHNGSISLLEGKAGLYHVVWHNRSAEELLGEGSAQNKA